MLKTHQNTITESIIFLESPRLHFLPSSRPPTYICIYIYYIYIYTYIYILYIYILYIYIYTYIYPQTRVLSFPGFISVARVNEWRTSDVIGVLKAPGAELCQNACGVVNEQNIFCSQQYSSEGSMNKFRAYISTDTCFILLYNLL